MQITVLINNVANSGRGEWGFSCLVEDEDLRVLLDTGASELLMFNANLLGEDLLHLDAIVLSHGHWDHTWGLERIVKHYISNSDAARPTIIGHPQVFCPKFRKNGTENGSLLSELNLNARFNMALTKEPQWLSNKLVWLGEIPRIHNYENIDEPGQIRLAGGLEDDYLLDDSALAYKTEQGLVIITGCSHSGICNIVERAKVVCSEERILDIVGGLHLIGAKDNKLRGTVEYIDSLNMKNLHACHCTGLPALVALSQVVSVEEVAVGTILKY